MSASDDEENKKKESEVENDDKEIAIRSTAVVKYSVPKVENFVELQCNTNLNLPPSNWLSDSADSYGLQRVSHGRQGFSSFRMAQMFPEVVANVDVIADAEIIKSLLKSPYNNEVISMMVHRLENTLLIDNFDIYDKIIRSTQNSNFKWLAEFILKHLGTKALRDARNLYVKCRTREALKENNLLSKFRYHSLVQKQNELLHENDVNETNSSRSVEYSFLPNPSPDTETPDPETVDHKYNRNVVWTFENIQMLLGTDMPIFGRGTYPCISLRLRDVNKPINILTGIDYWLDNLMSNVPEVFMCYHLNGIVQKYELIKTEDIPRLKNSKFSPLVIKDVAQNILSFLKTNATKAGHTYWLFKAKDEEIIKLYDLTCLVPQDEKLQNPFTIPVAMLLYRVARSFMRSNEAKPSGTVKKLLTNCLKLLEEQKYPEIVTSSHFMMSEIYIPWNTNPEGPVFEQESCDNDLVYEADDEMMSPDADESAISYLDLEAQKTSTFVNKSAPPITGTAEERCIQAAHHVSKGMSCLKYFTEETKTVLQEDQVPMAKPNEPIPMGYSKLPGKKKGKKGRKNKDRKKKTEEPPESNKELIDEENALLIKCNQETQHLPKWKERHGKKDGMSWKDHLKFLLYEKLLLVYATLAEHYYKSSEYGSGLRCIRILAKSSIILNNLGIPNQLRENCLLGRAGDCLFMIANNWHQVETYKNQLRSYTDQDKEILNQLDSDEILYRDQMDDYFNVKCAIIEDIDISSESQLKTLMLSSQCYEEAMAVSETHSIIQRLGCCLNDMGKYYLNHSKLFENELTRQIVYKAEPYFERAVELFEKIKDQSNIALVYLNTGTMHRIYVWASSPNKRDLTMLSKATLYKAISYYKKAFSMIDVNTIDPKIWNGVNWELANTLYNMADALDDFPSTKGINVTVKHTDEARNEILSLLQRAIFHCDHCAKTTDKPTAQYSCSGSIHAKIGCVQHRHFLQYFEKEPPVVKKNLLALALYHYEKACNFYFLAMEPMQYITTQMKKISLRIYLSQRAVDPNKKLTHYRYALEILWEMQEMTDLLVNNKEGIRKANVPSYDESQAEVYFNEHVHPFVVIMLEKLQDILKNLLKLCSSKNPPNKDCPHLAEIYKQCYILTFALSKDMRMDELAFKFNDVLIKIKEMIHQK